MSAKRFFIADQDGCYWWTGVAADREHFITLLRTQGAVWEAYCGGQLISGDIDLAIKHKLVEVRELTPDEVASKQRCHTEDERGVIPLVQAAIGDLFCSEW